MTTNTVNKVGSLPEIRKLWHADRYALRDHLMRIEADNNTDHNCCADAGRLISESVDSLDWNQTSFLGVFDGRELRGVIEMSGTPDGDTSISMSLEASYQNRGLGTQLLDRALVLARSTSTGRLNMACLPGNAKMQSVASKLGATVTPYERDSTAVRPAFLSLLENLNGAARTALCAWLDLDHVKPLT